MARRLLTRAGGHGTMVTVRARVVRRDRVRAASLLLVLAGLAAMPGGAVAGGFALPDQSARALGSAFVGEAAEAADASTLFYNPAGATRLPGSQLTVSGILVAFVADFENEGSTLNPALGGGALRGDGEVDGGEIGILSSAHLLHQLSDRWWVGLAVTVPWGLSINYDRDWVGRYHAILSELKTVDVAPTVAVRIVDQLSFGVGLDVQYAYTKLSGALDLGGICALNAPRLGLPPAACTFVGLTPQSVDGFNRVRATSWAVGYNLGLMWEPSARTRVGLSYRSRIDHTLEGDAEFDVPRRARVLRRLSGALVNTTGSADLNLPEIVRLAVYHELTPRWAIQTGVDWTHWSRFDELVFAFDNPAQPPIVQPERWHDTWTTGLAVLHRPAERWLVRAGFTYDPTPVPNEFRRTPRIPDHDRYRIGAGVSFALTERIGLDFAYSHLFSETARTENPDPVTGHIVRGTYAGSANVFGMQLTWRFR